MAGQWYKITIERVYRYKDSPNGNPVWSIHLSNGQIVHTAWDFEVGNQITPDTAGEFNAYMKRDRVLYLNPLEVGVR